MNLDTYQAISADQPVCFLMAPQSLWRFSGPDAERYLNGQITNDLTKLAEGHAFRAAVCTAKGRMEGDISIARHEGAFYIDADISLRESLGARLDKFLIADDAILEDITEEWSLVHYFCDVPPKELAGGFAISHARFGYDGCDFWKPGTIENTQIKHEKIANADVIETLRLENGIPRWGAELTANTLPPEAGPHMLAAISYTKGCYVGQETIARLKSVGHVNKTLVFLRSATAQFPPVGAKLVLDGHEVGAVTSSGFSPRLKKGIALAYVQRQHASDGAVLTTEGHVLTVAPSLMPGEKS
jgi:folate-binding protein YgfZ